MNQVKDVFIDFNQTGCSAPLQHQSAFKTQTDAEQLRHQDLQSYHLRKKNQI